MENLCVEITIFYHLHLPTLTVDKAQVVKLLFSNQLDYHHAKNSTPSQENRWQYHGFLQREIVFFLSSVPHPTPRLSKFSKERNSSKILTVPSETFLEFLT